MDMEEKQFVAVLQKITKSKGFVVEIKSYGFYDAEKEVGVEREWVCFGSFGGGAPEYCNCERFHQRRE